MSQAKIDEVQSVDRNLTADLISHEAVQRKVTRLRICNMRQNYGWMVMNKEELSCACVCVRLKFEVYVNRYATKVYRIQSWVMHVNLC